MKRIVLVMFMLLFAAGSTCETQAQSWLEKVGKNAAKRAENRAKDKVEEKVDRAVDKAVDKPFNAAEEAVKGDSKPADSAEATDHPTSEPAEAQPRKPAEISWNKFDFVAGDEVMFDDRLAGEKIGEFPSQWDLKSGYAEVMLIDGENAIYLTKETRIRPYMKEKNYLPDVFTIEFDIYVPGGTTDPKIGLNSRYNINLVGANDKNVFQIYWYNPWHNATSPVDVDWEWTSADESNHGEVKYPFKYNDFNRLSISFNKRAMKVYLNQTRVVNIPRCDAPASFNIHAYQGDKEWRFIKNIRIAKGAVPLYDRMMSDGKFITYGIGFDVGKSVIKPESMGEINRIVQLMTENPTLKFSVEGHTDATGNPASNQTLSEARSQAIVAKIVELGIAADRLTAVGKGSSAPIADNSTDEGRAKNRRVEFVKMESPA